MDNIIDLMKISKEKFKTMWFRLDNSAVVYPMVRTLSAQSIFRLGAEFYENVDEAALASALEKSYERYPYFKVELQMGAFRPYFISNPRKPIIEPNDGTLLKRIDFYRNHGYLIRVTYYNKKIFVDFFHGLCDGVGAMEFLKTLIYYYIKEKGNSIDTEDKIKIIEKPFSEGEIEDGFRKNHTPTNFKKGFKSMTSGLALSVRGKHIKKEGLGLIQGAISTQKLLEVSKSYGCSLTVFLAALALFSVASTQPLDLKSRNDYLVFIPVNLRNFYPSITNFNFTTLAKCKVNPRTTPLTLEAYIKEVKVQLAAQIAKEELDLKISFTSLMDKNPILRFTPLFFKVAMAKLGRSLTGGSKQTMILSNLGRVNVPQSFSEYVKEIFFNQNCNSKTPDNIGVVSYFDRTVISFSREILETKIEEFYFTELSKRGLVVELVSNFREVQDAL
ncbi:MAG: hypothetical protein EOM87_05575 [Clostridia bacterium]|nr:hypothetical protein [Clostridia bacterium]